MTDQLLLLPTDRAWQLDPPTRERGLKGVAEARAVILAVRARDHAEVPDRSMSDAA